MSDSAPAKDREAVPLVAHIILRLAVGGMENGLVNLINRTSPDRYRHAVICLDNADDFRTRITRDNVPVLELGKRPGKDPVFYFRLWRALRRLRPDIAHTRNLPTIELPLVAALARVPARVHGEHGRDMVETAGDHRKYNLVRRLASPAVDRYITVSRDLESWLATRIGVPQRKIAQIYNGVDCRRFHPAEGTRGPLPVDGFAGPETIVIGTVGRMETLKDQATLAEAFIRLCRDLGADAARLRLALIGEGTRREAVTARLTDAGLRDQVWLPGDRNDIPDLLRALDVFVLPSMNEGISNTILEAMASGLPVVATAVGGNPELVTDGETGTLVPPRDPDALAAALARYVADPALIARHGTAARDRAVSTFDLGVMVENYLAVYDTVLAAKR